MPTEAAVEGLHLPTVTVEDGVVTMGDTAGPTSSGPIIPPGVGGGASEQPCGEPTSAPAGVEPKEKESAGQPLNIGEGLSPVPAKLVAKILRGEFVDMAELLRDNIEMDRRRGHTEDGQGGPKSPRQRREVPYLLSWIQCFGVYICVVASKHPERVSQLLAYQTMLVREARRCGGSGWMGYDRMFRLQAASGEQVDWSQLNSSLYATTFLAQQNGRGRTCQHCLETDHSGPECAMAPATKAVDRWPRGGGLGLVPGAPRSELGKGDPSGEMGSRDLARGRNRLPLQRQERRAMVCYSWNDGACRFHPYCRYKHVSTKCQGDHRAPECPTYPGKPGETSTVKGPP